MKEVLKTILWILLLTALLMALIPFPRFQDDGGTVEYTALLYKVSDVRSAASLEQQQSGKDWDEGTIIEILGFEVFNNVR